MKICFLITGLGTGGAERFLLNLVPKLKFDKFIISLMNLNDIGKILEKKGIRIYYLGLKKVNLLLVILKFLKIIRKEKPDIIDTYLIHANLFGRIFGRLFGIKFIISSIRSNYSSFKILNFLDRISRKLVNLYILNSKALFNYIHNKNKVEKNKIEIITNGVDLSKIYRNLDINFDVRKQLGINKDSYIISYVGRLIKDKNIDVLIKTMKLLKNNFYLLIIGEGIEETHLKNLTYKLNLEKRIFFLGKLLHIDDIVNSSNIFVLPSIREGMSNALLEAMALKKICIVSNIPQNRLLIKDGFNGLVFNPNNIEDLADKITYAFEHRNKLQFGLESFKIIQENYNIRDIIDKYENVIEQLLEPKY